MTTEPNPLWSDDRIYRYMDKNRFTVLYNDRIVDVVTGGMAEGICMEICDDYEAALGGERARVAAAEQRVKELEAQLAAASQGWEPLPDGRYELDTEERSYLVVENHGEYGYQRTEQVFPGMDEISTFHWTGNIRLCRCTQAQDEMTEEDFDRYLVEHGVFDKLLKQEGLQPEQDREGAADIG